MDHRAGSETGAPCRRPWTHLRRRVSTLGFALVWISSSAYSEEPAAGAEAHSSGASFRKDIAPILTKKCLKCHGAEKPKGGYQLQTFSLLTRPGDSKNLAVAPGEPGKSELYLRITATDEDDRMPQKDDPLPASQIRLIERWIKEGARFDGSDPNALLVTLIPREPYPDPPASYRYPVPVTALAFSADGGELAVSGYHEITVWGPSEGKLLRRIGNVTQRIYGLAYQPDGSLLAAVGGAPGQTGEAALYDPIRGALIRSLCTTSDVLLALSFSPDGARLAVGGADNAIRFFDLASGKEELLIQQHADWVMALAFSRDGARLASASRDRSARIYSARTGELETSYNEHGQPVLAVAFDESGRQVFSAGKDRRIQFWNTADAKKNGELTGFESDITKLLPEGTALFACSNDKNIRQYTIPDRKLVRTYLGHKDWVYSLAHHPATHRLASGSHDGEVRLWNTEDGKLEAAFIAAPGYVAAHAGELNP